MSEACGAGASRASPPRPPVDPGRCPACGYQLAGLQPIGRCPECGTPYTPQTTLRPWPSALTVCGRLGWPVVGLVLAMTLIQVGEGLPRHSGGDPLAARGIGPGVVYLGLFLGCVAIVVAVINGYVVIRRMLKRSLPRNVRTRGPVAILRAIGTLLCVLIVTALVLPMVVFGACLLYAVD